MTRIIRTYQELILLPTFEERFEYLKLSGNVGEETFGFDRWLNQMFYKDPNWRSVRDEVIIRDNGCEFGLEDYPIHGRIIVHHMNPIYPEDIVDRSDLLLNPNFLICVSHTTHNAVHYGDKNLLTKELIVRKPGDTKLW